MPKNVSCNAFYIFMLETKKRLEARGRTFHSMEEVVGIAAEPWERMTQEQKSVYKEKAKEFKKSDEFSAYKKDVRGRLPKSMRPGGGGATASRRMERPVEEEEFIEPIAHLFPSDEEDAVEEFRKKHEKDRNEILDSWKWNLADRPEALLDLKFYVLSFISHCRTGSYAYFPAEMAIVEVTLRDGVTNSYCRILGPHELPPNMVEAATRYSEVHKIPFDVPIEGMTKDYVRVMEEVLRFCRPSKNLRRLYCIQKEFNCVQGCVKFLQTEAKQVEIRADRINCIEDLLQLFCQWRDKICAPAEWRVFNDCDGASPMAPYYKNPGLLCDYHSTRGVHHCALATAKRAAYYLLQRVLSHFPIELTDQHRPPPMPPGSEQDQMEAAASGWQMARVAAQRAQLLAGHFEDDSASMASGTTVNTRRTIPYDDPERRDMGGPRTLPGQLRRAVGHADAPDDWNDEKKIDVREANHSRLDVPQMSRGTAPSAQASSSGFPLDAATATISWEQNKKVRDQVERVHNVSYQPATAPKPPPDSGAFGGRDGNIRNEGSYATAAQGPRMWTRPPMGQERFQTDSDSSTDVASNLASEFGQMRCAPPPVAFPPPQNVTNPGMMGSSGGFPEPSQRAVMAPRVAMPPSAMGIANTTAVHRPPFGRGHGILPNQSASRPVAQLIANETNAYGIPQPTAMRTGGPPVRTQSRVKQMLTERLRQEPSE